MYSSSCGIPSMDGFYFYSCNLKTSTWYCLIHLLVFYYSSDLFFILTFYEYNYNIWNNEIAYIMYAHSAYELNYPNKGYSFLSF